MQPPEVAPPYNDGNTSDDVERLDHGLESDDIYLTTVGGGEATLLRYESLEHGITENGKASRGTSMRLLPQTESGGTITRRAKPPEESDASENVRSSK